MATPGCVTSCDSHGSRDKARDRPRDTEAEHQHEPGAGSGPGTGGSLCCAGRYSLGSQSSAQLTLASIVKQTRGG